MKTRWMTIPLLLLTACGGGGAGSPDPSFAGVWKGRLDVAWNSCEPDDRTPIDTTITVNQDGPRIVADFPSGTTVAGSADGDTLTAFGSQALEECSARYALEMVRGEDDDAVATIDSTISCGIFACQVKWTGRVERL